ncbi:MAG: metallopeptidase family protein [Trueperaceae bacterium]
MSNDAMEEDTVEDETVGRDAIGQDAMSYQEFQRLVEEMVREIPDEFLRGLQGVHALEHERPEEEYEEVWRMGEYLDPGAEDFLGAGEGLGRHVALYYGSFRRIAEFDPEFDWEEEIWETLTHELRHHVESLAGDASLIEEDMRHGAAFTRREHEP